MAYCVDLEIFRGPLDLLLYLVRKDELDIFDIPIARVAHQYLAYLKLLQMIDMEVAGEFLVMATTLMEIKSRMLLPSTAAEVAAEEDPRMQLVRQLLEYKKFRDAAEHLQELADEQRQHFVRVAVDRPDTGADPTTEPIRDVELWDLVSAFGRLMRQTLALAPRSIVYDETPIEVHMENVLRRLSSLGQLAFTELFEGQPTRGRIVGIFLAILELVKSKRVRAEQNEPFGEIWILPAHGDAAAPEVSVVSSPTGPEPTRQEDTRLHPVSGPEPPVDRSVG